MKKIIVSTLLFGCSLFAGLSDFVTVEDAYIRATPPNSKNSAGFMKLVNSSNENISITGAVSFIAKATELHTHKNVDGVMKMSRVQNIEINKNSFVELKPGSFHIMFMGLNKDLKSGEMVDLSLNFSDGSKKDLKVIVKEISKMPNMNDGMKHKH